MKLKPYLEFDILHLRAEVDFQWITGFLNFRSYNHSVLEVAAKYTQGK